MSGNNNVIGFPPGKKYPKKKEYKEKIKFKSEVFRDLFALLLKVTESVDDVALITNKVKYLLREIGENFSLMDRIVCRSYLSEIIYGLSIDKRKINDSDTVDLKNPNIVLSDYSLFFIQLYPDIKDSVSSLTIGELKALNLLILEKKDKKFITRLMNDFGKQIFMILSSHYFSEKIK